jgi:hypothetical protein
VYRPDLHVRAFNTGEMNKLALNACQNSTAVLKKGKEKSKKSNNSSYCLVGLCEMKQWISNNI